MRTLVGRIEVVCGSMFSGKTEELVRRLRRAQYGRQRVQAFKHAIDERYSKSDIHSHNATRIASIPVSNPAEILEHLQDSTRVVGIDEVQFFDIGLVDVVQKLADRGLQVVLAGLDMDYLGKPFGIMPQLLAIAESVTKLSAICVVCGAPASRSQRLQSFATSTDQILVGASESYEARCRGCHEPELDAPTPRTDIKSSRLQ
ncbi:MAG: thymidine kinase [Bdellovibrionales bacterium]|nr:thymidine kinase [Bdellovibrionales bacterium]